MLVNFKFYVDDEQNTIYMHAQNIKLLWCYDDDDANANVCSTEFEGINIMHIKKDFLYS